MNISECYLSQLETGYRQLSRKMLINICNAYQVKPNEVLEYDNYVEIAENEYNEQEKVIDLINKKKV